MINYEKKTDRKVPCLPLHLFLTKEARKHLVQSSRTWRQFLLAEILDSYLDLGLSLFFGKN